MKTYKLTALTIVLLTTLLLPNLANAKPKVVATVGDLAAVAREVGGDHIHLTLLANPREDTHFVDAKPSFIKDLAGADLLIFNGMSLEEGWLPTLIKGSRNPKVQPGAPGHFDAASAIEKMGVPTQKVTRAAGDIHPEGNPHYTADPRQMARVAIALGKRLGEVDPKNADAYRTRARDFARQALARAKKWEQQFHALPPKCRNIAVYHDAWAYIQDWLKLNPIATIEPKPGVPPAPKHVASVFKAISTHHAHVILQMEYYPDAIAKNIAQKSGALLIRVPGQTRRDQAYLDRVDAFATSVYSAIKEKCN